VKSWLERTLFRKTQAVGEPAPNTESVVDRLIASGHAMEDSGHPEEALPQYLRAIELDPQSAKAYLNAGNAYRLLQNSAQAILMYRRAAELDPESAGAQLNLGTALLAEKKCAPAEEAYRAALRMRPEWAEAWVGLGCVLEESNAIEEAIAAYSRALAIQPDHHGAVSNLSALQLRILDVTGARQTLENYLRRMPNDRQLLQRLADLELDAGRIRESLAIQRAVIEQQPDDFAAWSKLLFNLFYLPDITAEESLCDHLRFGRLLESQTTPRTLKAPGRGDGERRLNVGYVSGDFNIHPIANFIHPILRNHDRKVFTVFCYHALQNADHLTAELKSVADYWRDVATLDDDRLADLVQQDRIDILVDLSGHSNGNRLATFARKPAAVQFTWLGHLGTTGLSRIDYRLCDSFTDPADVAEHWQVEKPARLPDSQWCYDQRIVTVPPPSPLPRVARGCWTFGSFNNYRKLNERVFAAWADVLKAIPDSRLRLYSFENRESGERAVSALASQGIERERISWHLRTSPQGHFESFADVDIALDSFPYNGATTTCDALLMGVPVLVVAGTRSVARGGVSLLSAIGMTDWIAESEPHLAMVARRRLADVESIVRLRAELPQRMRTSALMDAQRFTGNLEAQYRAAWRRWCENASGA
jgi:predicted O-linked N-acetylglucosamine transferase (SPINDLY family)